MATPLHLEDFVLHLPYATKKVDSSGNVKKKDHLNPYSLDLLAYHVQ